MRAPCIMEHAVFIGILVMELLKNSNGLLSYNTTPKSCIGQLTTLLEHINAEEKIETLLLVDDQEWNWHLPLADASHGIPMPVLILTNRSTVFQLKANYNNQMLAVVCMTELDSNLKSLQVISRSFELMREARIIIMITSKVISQTQLGLISNFCEAHKMVNVLAVNPDLTQCYRLNPFPSSQFKHIQIEVEEYFPQHWHDFQGKIVKTLPDQVLPRSFLYLNPKTGTEEIIGIFGIMISLFSKMHNLRLQFAYPVKSGEIVKSWLITNLTRDKFLDLPISMTITGHSGKGLVYTYPLGLSEWLIIVPCPSRMAINEFYANTRHQEIFWFVVIGYVTFSICFSIIRKVIWRSFSLLDLLINDKALRGILGQTFAEAPTANISLKQIYILICLHGLVVSTLYSASLNTFYINPPNHKEIKTFAELRHSNIPVLFGTDTRKLIETFRGAKFFNRTLPNAVFLETKDVVHERFTMNQHFAYSVGSASWFVLSEQQQFYKHKVYCTPPELKIIAQFPYSIPLPENSVYELALNNFIQRVHTAGLLNFWLRKTLYEMMRLKKIKLKDPFKSYEVTALKVHDLQKVWLISFAGLTLSILIFLIELCVIHFKFERFTEIHVTDIN